jgi:hypothetical protein
MPRHSAQYAKPHTKVRINPALPKVPCGWECLSRAASWIRNVRSTSQWILARDSIKQCDHWYRFMASMTVIFSSVKLFTDLLLGWCHGRCFAETIFVTSESRSVITRKKLVQCVCLALKNAWFQIYWAARCRRCWCHLWSEATVQHFACSDWCLVCHWHLSWAVMLSGDPSAKLTGLPVW